MFAGKQIMARKPIGFDDATWQALEVLRRDKKKTLQELMDEAVGDLLKKHNRPTTLKEMLKESARKAPANDVAPKPVRPKRRSREC